MSLIGLTIEAIFYFQVLHVNQWLGLQSLLNQITMIQKLPNGDTQHAERILNLLAKPRYKTFYG